MKRTIAIITNNTKGGVLQLAAELLRDVNEMGINAFLFAPTHASFTLNKSYESKVVTYEYGNKKLRDRSNEMLFNNSLAKSVTKQVLRVTPDLVILIDDKIITSKIGLCIKDYCKTVAIIHDAIMHPQKRSLKRIIYVSFWEVYRKILIHKSHYIIALSEESKKKIGKRYSIKEERILVLALGAHLPECNGVKPKEVKIGLKYILFFGRFEKYKGIDILISAFHLYDSTLNLIIAGEGEFCFDNCENPKIYVLNRYIKDDEMKWLIQNSQAIVLPYKEASQSGILPMAYYFGVPVIVSNIDGLTQFVDDGRTGIICNGIEDFAKAFSLIENEYTRTKMSLNAKDYYSKNLSWKTNLERLFKELISY